MKSGQRTGLRLPAWAKVAITSALCFWLLNVIDWPKLGSSLKSFRMGPFTVLLVTYALFLTIGGLKIFILARSVRPGAIGPWRCMKYFLVGTAFGAITPMQAGELALVPLLKREGYTTGEATGVIVTDKLVTLGLFCFAGLLGCWVYVGGWGGLRSDFLFYAATIGGAATIAVILLHTYIAPARSALNSIRAFVVNNRGAIAQNATLTVVRLLVAGGTIVLGLAVFGTTAAYWNVLWLSSLGRLVTYLPISINGLGLLEGSAVVLLGRIGIAAETTLLAFLVNRAIHYTFCMGVLAVWVASGHGSNVGDAGGTAK